jgi:cold shock CspA family protein
MTKGSITKLVGTFGSQWGRIRPQGGTRDIFFNTASLDKAVEFPTLVVGEQVAFEEVPDNVNGSHAAHILVMPPLPDEKGRTS